MSVCWTLLEFTLPEETEKTSDINTMIDDIVKYQNLWEQNQNKFDEKTLQVCEQEMIVNYIYLLNIAEKIGIDDKERIQKLVTECEEHIDKRNKSLSKEEVETKNICKAWKQLTRLSTFAKGNKGFLEVSVVQDLHRTLMTGIIDEKINTPPGRFSTKPRSVYWKGEVHWYPVQDTQYEWQKQISIILDRYNGLIQAIKMKKGNREATLQLFKCASYLLFNLISLHPFSDGNGRLCRTLASYAMFTHCPFPSPICDILINNNSQNNFIRAIVRARENGNLAELCLLVIKSNWSSWKTFLSLCGVL